MSKYFNLLETPQAEPAPGPPAAEPEPPTELRIRVDENVNSWTKSIPAPVGEPMDRWRRRLEGLRRWIADGWHEKALEAGWSRDELYGQFGVVWDIERSNILFVDDRLIMVKNRNGGTIPLYREAE
jgi:hypothetical protein